MISTMTLALEAKLSEVIREAGQEPPSFGFGEHSITDQDAPPKITWVPIGGPLKRAKFGGVDGDAHKEPVWDRDLGIAARVWADNVDQAEILCQQLAAAIQDVAPGHHSPVSEEWDTKSHAGNGVVCVVSFTVKGVFVREPLALVQIRTPPTSADLPITGQILGGA